MMKILWVKMGGMWPPTSGGRTRSLQIISELSRRHAVTIVTTHSDGDDPAGLVDRLPRCERILSFEYSVPKRGSTRFPLSVARSWLSRAPVDLWTWRGPAGGAAGGAWSDRRRGGARGAQLPAAVD